MGSSLAPLTSKALESRRPLVIAAFAVAYVLSLQLSERVYGTLGVSSPFWLPDSIFLCALMLAETREWWIFVAVVWPIRLALGALPGTPEWFVIVSIANDTLKALAAAWLLRRLLGTRVRLETLNEFLVFLGVAAGAVPLLSALAAAPARYALGDPPWSGFFGWFLGDALAQVVVTPMVLFWICGGVKQRRVELIVLLGALTAASFYVFVDAHNSYPPSLMYLPMPFLIWAAVRLGPAGTSTAIALMAVVSMVGASRGSGLFAGEAIQHSILSLQLFLFMSAVPLLSLAILVAERETLRTRELGFNGKLLEAQERERTRVALELHDDVAQRLAALHAGLEHFRRTMVLHDEANAAIDGLTDVTAGLSKDVRTLSHELHPATLDLVGLNIALKGLCREFGAQHRLQIDYSCAGLPDRLERAIALSVFRIAQEALRNVVKHSGAAEVIVMVSSEDGCLELSVIDEGVGFDVNAVNGQGGLGLVSMHERLRPLGGSLSIRSVPGAGTRVLVRVPIQVPPAFFASGAGES